MVGGKSTGSVVPVRTGSLKPYTVPTRDLMGTDGCQEIDLFKRSKKSSRRRSFWKGLETHRENIVNNVENTYKYTKSLTGNSEVSTDIFELF